MEPELSMARAFPNSLTASLIGHKVNPASGRGRPQALWPTPLCQPDSPRHEELQENARPLHRQKNRAPRGKADREFLDQPCFAGKLRKATGAPVKDEIQPSIAGTEGIQPVKAAGH